MKKLIAIFVLLAVAGGGTWYYYNYGQKKEKPQVLTAAVSRQDITEVVQATGSLEATRLVPVGSQVSGTVKDLHGVDFNSIVKKGQVIAELDDSLLKVQVDIANANIQRSMNDIEQSKVQLENDKLNLARMQAQFDAKLVAKQQLEAAQLQVKSREASIASALKGITQQQATLAQAELNVKYCTIVSPIDGVIVERKVDIGQAVQSSVNVAQFFTIATDLTSLKLTAMVDEAEIGKVRRGMPVLFKVDSYGSQDFSGTVDAVRLNATNNQNVVTYPVWITVPNSDLKLKPSMTASIRIIISTAESALRIPNGALRFKPNTETYVALGLTPPTAGGGRNAAAGPGGAPGGNTRGQGGQGANAGTTGAPPPAADAAATPPAAAPPAPGASKAPSTPTGQPGQQAQNMSGRGGQGGQSGRGGQGGGNPRPGGFGQGTQMTQQGMADFNRNRAGRGGGGGGRGGGQSGGGRGGGRPQTPANATGNATPLTQRTAADGTKAEKIDDLFPDLPKIVQRGTVYTWDEAKKELKGISVSYGVTDGQFSELITGDVQVGTNLVTSVIIPQVVKPGAPNANPFMGQQPGRGMGGMTPGGGGPGGGGGGGGRGGGGGGGRGGN